MPEESVLRIADVTPVIARPVVVPRVKLKIPPPTAFKNPAIVVEPVTASAEVVAPVAVRLVKLANVEKRLVEVALVEVELNEMRLCSHEVEDAMKPAPVAVT